MRKTTRERILDIINRRQVISTAELGNILGLTLASVRHHLHILQAESIIDIVGQKKDTPGRPTNIYGLSDHLLDGGREQLLLIALEELFTSFDEEAQKKKIRKLATTLVDKLGRGDSELGPQQLALFLDKIKGFNYFPHWQASLSGAQIFYSRCPYKGIINQYPQLCDYDRYILEEYFGAQVDLIEKMVPPNGAIRQCLFQLNMRRSNSK